MNTAYPAAWVFTPGTPGSTCAVCAICPALQALSSPVASAALTATAPTTSGRRFERLTALLRGIGAPIRVLQRSSPPDAGFPRPRYPRSPAAPHRRARCAERPRRPPGNRAIRVRAQCEDTPRPGPTGGAEPEGGPAGGARGNPGNEATTATLPTERRDTRPGATGLTGRPTARARAAWCQSLVLPLQSWLAASK